MKPGNIKFFRYLKFVFIIATLAYTLYFLLALAYGQPMGTYDLLSAYIWGYILHMPLWIGALLISGVIIRKPIKRSIIFYSGALILILLIAPLVFKAFEEWFDYITLPFYATDFLFCLFLLLRIKTRGWNALLTTDEE